MNNTPCVNTALDLEFREYKLSDDFPVLALSPRNDSAYRLLPLPKYHFHNCLEIGFCFDEVHTLFFENREYTLHPGDFFILSPFSMHYVDQQAPEKPHCCKYLFVKPEELLRPFYHLGLPEDMQWYKNSETPFIFSETTHGTIYHMFMLLLTEYRTQDTGYQHAVRGLFQTIMLQLSRELSALTVPSSRKYHDFSMLLPALKAMHFDYAQPINTQLLAEHCHMSPSTFRALFQKHLGTSHIEYLKCIRLQKACELLYGTELTVLNISMEVGFTSLTAFYQSFRSRYHTSPRKWREMYRTVQKKNISRSLFSLSETK